MCYYNVVNTKAAGLIYGSYLHHLDHLAVLCILLDIPLIVTEKEIEKEAQRHYPKLTTIYMPAVHLALRVVHHYKIIFSSLPKDLFDRIFFITENILEKKLLNIWVPHGNSDKGYASPLLDGLAKEKIVLVYGQKMIDSLIEKNIFPQFYDSIVLGNYRLDFYKKHRKFYDKMVKREILDKLPQSNKTVLYAPTWEDGENSCSLKATWPKIAKTVPKDWNLILKLHPNICHQLHEVEMIINAAREKSNIYVVKHFSPIYPLLKVAHIYLGDMSSIGYDFLSFFKPMFFLNQTKRDPKSDKGLYLFRCGTTINPEEYDSIFSIMQRETRDFTQVQKQVYLYVFGKQTNQKELKNRIKMAYERYFKASPE